MHTHKLILHLFIYINNMCWRTFIFSWTKVLARVYLHFFIHIYPSIIFGHKHRLTHTRVHTTMRCSDVLSLRESKDGSLSWTDQAFHNVSLPPPHKTRRKKTKEHARTDTSNVYAREMFTYILKLKRMLVTQSLHSQSSIYACTFAFFELLYSFRKLLCPGIW